MKCTCSKVPPNVKIIKVGETDVGIIDLIKTIKEVYFLKIEDEARIKEKLLEKVKANNSIPPERESLYGEALLREYFSYVERRFGVKKALAPPVKKDSGGFLRFLTKVRKGKGKKK